MVPGRTFSKLIDLGNLMTTKLSSGRERFRRSTAALGIAGLTLAWLADPALADGEEPEQPATSEPSGDANHPMKIAPGRGKRNAPPKNNPRRTRTSTRQIPRRTANLRRPTH